MRSKYGETVRVQCVTGPPTGRATIKHCIFSTSQRAWQWLTDITYNCVFRIRYKGSLNDYSNNTNDVKPKLCGYKMRKELTAM